MIRISQYLLAFVLICWGQTLIAANGDVTVRYGKTNIALNQVFKITISVENERLQKHGAFPNIKGFNTGGRSSSTNTTIVNGKMTVISSITQNYFPTQEGRFKVPRFKIEVNGKNYSVEGTTVIVGPAVQQRRYDPFAWDPFEEYRQDPQELEYVDVEADAFFSITTDKRSVYKGEGFNLTLSFFVARSNQAQMRWPGDLAEQVADIIKKVKPANVWEENFNVQEIQKNQVKINGKNYDQFILYQATFFPLNSEDIYIPSAGLRLVKYKEAKQRGFFGRPRVEDDEVFKSRPKTIRVKELPDHPLKNSVSVGRYKLEESLEDENFETGKSFTYNFEIQGSGNIAGVNGPEAIQDEHFDFFSPEVFQNIQRNSNQIRGKKTFKYYAVPKEPGNFKLEPYFNWVYFNPVKRQYDTLKSTLAINVTGESHKNKVIKSSDFGTFYDRILLADNKLRPLHSSPWARYFLTGIIILACGLIGFLYFKQRNEK